MAILTVAKVARPHPVSRRENSRVRLSARRVGLDIPEPHLSLPKAELEAADIS